MKSSRTVCVFLFVSRNKIAFMLCLLIDLVFYDERFHIKESHLPSSQLKKSAKRLTYCKNMIK